MHRPSTTITAYVALCGALATLWVGGCSKDKTMPAPAPAAKSLPPPAAKPAPAKLVDLGMDEGRYVSAAITERCARAAGETAADARTVAIDQIAGRPHQAVTLEAVAAAAKKDAAPIPGAATPVGKEAPTAGTDAASRTPAGRYAPGPSDAAHIGRYERANKRAKERADIRKRIAEGVRDCLWAPELGQVERELIDRFVATFVGITCAAEKLRDKAGKIDELAHAHAAVEIFAKHGFKAPEFARLGPILGRFAQIEKEMYDGRRAQCQDPREVAAQKAINGAYIGSFSGSRSGVLRVQAADGSLTGTVEFGPLKKAAAGQPAKLESWPIRGAISVRRVYLLGNKELAFIRLEGGAQGDGYGGRWQGELAFKKVSGKWSIKRPPPPPAAPAPVPPSKP